MSKDDKISVRRDEFGDREWEPDKHILDEGTPLEIITARLERYAAVSPHAVAQQLAHLLSRRGSGTKD